MKAFDVVKGFECELGLYTGARYVVACNSATSALQLAFEFYEKFLLLPMPKSREIILPERTYRSVAAMARRAGLEVRYEDIPWCGVYEIKPTDIWDCALRLAPGMYVPGTVQVLSFHPQKPLALSSGGGAILHDNLTADKFYRLDRFDGRTEGVSIQEDGWPFDGAHCYMFPGQAGEALHRLEIFKAAHPEGLTMPQPNYENLRVKEGVA